jgi:hypothetical protein
VRPELKASKLPAFVTAYWRKRETRGLLAYAGVDADAADLIACLTAASPRGRPDSAAMVGASFAEAATRASGRAS